MHSMHAKHSLYTVVYKLVHRTRPANTVEVEKP
jgi:hypothetical protein